MGFGFLGVGALYEDTIISLPHYPAEDHKQRASGVTSRLGGNIPNTVRVLSQITTEDDRLVFVGTFAEKKASLRLTNQLAQMGVEVAGVWRDCPNNPQSWILKSEQSGSRTIVNYNSVEEFTADELLNAISAIPTLQTINWVHFEGRIPEILKVTVPQIRRLIPQATFSLEIEKPDRHSLLELIPFFSIIFFSHTFYSRSGYFTPESFFDAMRERNQSAVYALTVGENGAYYSSPVDQFLHIPTTRVDVVDATGAGDTFIAGFIGSMMILRQSGPECTKMAVSLATTKVGQEGFDSLWK